MPSCPVAGSLGENAIVMMSACDGTGGEIVP